MFLLAYIGLTVPVLLIGGALALFAPVPVLVVFSAVIALLVVVAGPRLITRAGA